MGMLRCWMVGANSSNYCYLHRITWDTKQSRKRSIYQLSGSCRWHDLCLRHFTRNLGPSRPPKWGCCPAWPATSTCPELMPFMTPLIANTAKVWTQPVKT